jgi:hypothetical protein
LNTAAICCVPAAPLTVPLTRKRPKRHHRIARVDRLADFAAPLVEDFRRAHEDGPPPVMVVVGAGEEGGWVDHPNHGQVDLSPDRLAALIALVDEPSDDLHVVPGHRLLPHPNGFEGRLGIAVAGKAPDSTPLQLKQETRDRVDLNTAGSAQSAYPHNHRDSIPAVVKLDRIDSKRLPILVYVADEPPQAFMPAINDPLQLRPERQQLAVLREQADRPVRITRVERLERAANNLDVLARHCLSP